MTKWQKSVFRRIVDCLGHIFHAVGRVLEGRQCPACEVVVGTCGLDEADQTTKPTEDFIAALAKRPYLSSKDFFVKGFDHEA